MLLVKFSVTYKSMLLPIPLRSLSNLIQTTRKYSLVFRILTFFEMLLVKFSVTYKSMLPQIPLRSLSNYSNTILFFSFFGDLEGARTLDLQRDRLAF